MAYEKTTWVSGETPLSADNMNNIEDGIETLENDVEELNNKIGIISITGPFTVSQTEGFVFALPNNYRGIITIHDSNTNNNGLYMVYSTSAGVVDAKAISEASNVTIVTSYSNRFRINPTTGTPAVMAINILGTATQAS